MWTVFDLLKRFLSDLYRATIFAALAYDEQLQMTKTTTQRLLIWFGILGIIGIIALLLLYGIWYVLDAFDVTTFD